jgi:hypothetical protein
MLRVCNLLDTTDFSRVVVQFLPNCAASKKAEAETPRDSSRWYLRISTVLLSRVKLKDHRLKPGGICVTQSLPRGGTDDLMGPRPE